MRRSERKGSREVPETPPRPTPVIIAPSPLSPGENAIAGKDTPHLGPSAQGGGRDWNYAENNGHATTLSPYCHAGPLSFRFLFTLPGWGEGLSATTFRFIFFQEGGHRRRPPPGHTLFRAERFSFFHVATEWKLQMGQSEMK